MEENAIKPHGHINGDEPYGCHNLPRPVRGVSSYVAQTGWRMMRDGFGNPCPVPVYGDIKFDMSEPCKYDKQDTDKRCRNCIHAPIDADFKEVPGATGPSEPLIIPLLPVESEGGLTD